MDRIATLQYSTLRQSNDSLNVLAITLELVVDFDLADNSQDDQGRLIFVPSQAIRGSVPAGQWHRWDARAGQWFGTSSFVTQGNKKTRNKCLVTSPCTWAQLLAAFPNIGVHPSAGALLLKAYRSWTSFRGNVDSLTIDVAGSSTTYDFEAVPAVVPMYHLQVFANDGVVFNKPLVRDTMLPQGTTVDFSFGSAPSPNGSAGDLLTVVDDTIASSSGTITMNGDHAVFAEVEYPLTPSDQVRDLMGRVTEVIHSSHPRQALADLMTWYAARDAELGNSSALRAALDTASFLALDPFADAATLDAFSSAVNGTEFYFSPYQPGHVYYSTSNFDPGSSTTDRKIGDGPSMLRKESSLQARQLPAWLSSESATRDIADDGEPDELTHVMYVNGILTLEDSKADGVASALGTSSKIRSLMKTWPRFGTGGDLRQNVTVGYFYNHSEKQVAQDYRAEHQCEAKAARETGMRQILHTLRRMAVCGGQEYKLREALVDLLECMKQIHQLNSGNVDDLVPDAYALAHRISDYHAVGWHVILIGHSQGDLLIAQAAQALPRYDQRPLNVGNSCTAVLALASPISSSRLKGLDPDYVRGLIVNSDILLTLGAENDFAKMRTSTGDSVATASFVSQPVMAVHAHYMDQNYLEDQGGAQHVRDELTLLSDGCSAGAFAVTSSPSVMTVRDTVRIGVDLRNRLGSKLRGRAFQGGTDVAYVSGQDSTVIAVNISDVPSTVPVVLYNTRRVQTTLTVNRVLKQAMVPTVTYTPYRTPDGGQYWIYTATVKRADGGPITWAMARPLDPQEGNAGSWLGSNTLAPVITVSYLDMWGYLPPSTRWEVRTYDGTYHVPMNNLVGVDTVDATAGNASIDDVNLESRLTVPDARMVRTDAPLSISRPARGKSEERSKSGGVAPQRDGRQSTSELPGAGSTFSMNPHSGGQEQQ